MENKDKDPFFGFTKSEFDKSKKDLETVLNVIVKPFVCDKKNCEACFKTSLELEIHKEKEHDIYKCEHCQLDLNGILAYASHFLRCDDDKKKNSQFQQQTPSTSSNSESVSRNLKKEFIKRFEEKN